MSRPHPLIPADDASSTSGDTVSTASSSTAGRVSAAVHPLEMPCGGDDGDAGDCSFPTSSDPLGESSSSSVMSLSSSDHSSGSSAGASAARSAARSAPLVSSRRASLSCRAFKVHADPVRRVSNDGGHGGSEHERLLENLVASLRKQVETAVRSAEKSESRAQRHAARCHELERDNDRLKSKLREAKEAGREHRALARKVVKDNARLMREANESQADEQRLSNLAEKVRSLASSAEGGAASRRSSFVNDAAADGGGATSHLDAVNLSNECESLRRENVRLKEDSKRMEEVLCSSVSREQQRPQPLPLEPPRMHRRASSETHHSRVAALKKMASIKGIASIRTLNETTVKTPEDFLWEE